MSDFLWLNIATQSLEIEELIHFCCNVSKNETKFAHLVDNCKVSMGDIL